MKRLLGLAVLLVAALFVFAACRNDDDNGNGGTLMQTATTTAPQTTRPEVDPLIPEVRTPVTLTYSNWNLGPEGDDNLRRRMIDAFMAEYDWITIEIIEPYDVWMDFLGAQAAIGALPDVFMVNYTAPMIINGWLRDITEFTNECADFNRLPAAIRDMSTYNNRVFTVPYQQFMQGYFVNIDLFNEFNLNPPQFGFSPDEFIAAVRDTTDLNRPSVGVNYLHHMGLWYPGARNPGLGFMTFDGNQFNLNSPEMLEAMRLATELSSTGHTLIGLPDPVRENFDGGWHGEVFINGQMALWWDGTWSDMAFNAGFEWDFIGVPGGRTVVVPDILGISATSQHPLEAYLFARWMGHGDAGFARRLDIAEAMGEAVMSLPFTTDAALLERYWATWGNRPGIMAAAANLGNALIDGGKIIPGFPQARWHTPTGVSVAHYENANIDQAMFWIPPSGAPNWADHAGAFNGMANEAFEAVNAELQRVLGGSY